MATNSTRRRNPLLPWFIGLVIVFAAVIYTAYRFYCTDCGVSPIPLVLVLGVVPIVYLALMYLTFTSQAKDEKRDRNDYDPR